MNVYTKEILKSPYIELSNYYSEACLLTDIKRLLNSLESYFIDEIEYIFSSDRGRIDDVENVYINDLNVLHWIRQDYDTSVTELTKDILLNIATRETMPKWKEIFDNIIYKLVEVLEDTNDDFVKERHSVILEKYS